MLVLPRLTSSTYTAPTQLVERAPTHRPVEHEVPTPNVVRSLRTTPVASVHARAQSTPASLALSLALAAKDETLVTGPHATSRLEQAIQSCDTHTEDTEAETSPVEASALICPSFLHLKCILEMRAGLVIIRLNLHCLLEGSDRLI